MSRSITVSMRRRRQRSQVWRLRGHEGPCWKRIVVAAVRSGAWRRRGPRADARVAAAVPAAGPATSRGISLPQLRCHLRTAAHRAWRRHLKLPSTSAHPPPVSGAPALLSRSHPTPWCRPPSAAARSSPARVSCTPCWIAAPGPGRCPNAPRRPDNLAGGAPWLPLPPPGHPWHRGIPGPGGGEIPAVVDTFFRQQLAAATGDDATRPVVIYCHHAVGWSWNAANARSATAIATSIGTGTASRALKAAGLPTAVVEPRSSAGADVVRWRSAHGPNTVNSPRATNSTTALNANEP